MELDSNTDFDPTRFFKDPRKMSDAELAREYQASQNQGILEMLTNPDVSDYSKYLVHQHLSEVDQEYKSRKNEEWIYPLSEFFF